MLSKIISDTILVPKTQDCPAELILIITLLATANVEAADLDHNSN